MNWTMKQRKISSWLAVRSHVYARNGLWCVEKSIITKRGRYAEPHKTEDGLATYYIIVKRCNACGMKVGA